MICSNPACGAEYKAYFTDDRNLCRTCDMLQSGHGPSIRTEATYQAKANGRLGLASVHPAIREHYRRVAGDAGVSTDGKTYEPRLASFPGDPQAWVSGPDEVRRVVEDRGWSMDGDMKVKGREVEPVKGPAIARELVEEMVESRLEEQLGEDFVEAKGSVVERAVDDVMSAHAAPPHIANA